MPNQITHFYFGQDVYKNLNGRAKAIIDQYPHAFRVGALGPDFMFVLREIGIGNAPRYANEMQYLHMFEVFDKAGFYIKANPSDCLTSYLLGLLCHYVSDFRGHAYINYFVEEAMPKYYPGKYQTALHPLLEAGIDEIIIIEYMKLNPRLYNSGNDLKPSRYELDKISELYKNVINDIIGFDVSAKLVKKAIRYTKIFLSFATDRTGLKKKLFNYLEDRKGVKKQMSSIIRPPYLMESFDFMNRNHLKWRKVRNEAVMTNESFDEVMANCKEIAIKYIDNYMAYLEENKPLRKEDFTINYEGVRVY